MTKIILNGVNGKMGQVIARIVEETTDCEIVCGFDINDSQKNNFDVYKNPNDFVGEADVIIDFSHPSSFDGLIKFALRRKLPIVIATTGLSKEQIASLENVAKEIPVFFSANMSLGVNLLIDLVQKAAKLLEDSFDIEIVEKHHNQKIDAPSGTALAIADALSDVMRNKPEYVYDRHSVRKKRGKQEIGIHAVRGGTIVGEHEVIFAGTDEIIEIKHCAMSKEIFAVGAVKAAKFLTSQKAAFYNMKDLVNSF